MISSHDPDYTLYEIHTFCELLLKGNPKVIEPLFQTHLCHYEKTSKWIELINNKQKFINSKVIKQYISFAKSQLYDSSKGKGTITKKYYHALRLLFEAKRMINYEEPKVWIEGEEREYLMSIRKNQIDSLILDKQVEEYLFDLNQKLEDHEFLTKINQGKTEEDLKEFLNDWLIKIRRETLIQKKEVNSMVSHPLYNLAMNELKRNGLEGDILCCCLSGKDLHNKNEILLSSLSSSSSNDLVDFIAVYVAPTNLCMGLYPLVSRISPDTSLEIRDTYTRGLAIHEVSNICNLIQQGNHRIMEILFSDRKEDFTTELWCQLKAQRKHFITQVVTNHYQGVGRGQLVAAVDNNKKTGLLKKQLHHVYVDANYVKDTTENRIKLYHAMRLLFFGSRIVIENKVPTHFLDDKNSGVIKGILNGRSSIQEAVELSNFLCKQVEELKVQLKDVPKRIEARYSNMLEEWLLSVRVCN